MTRKEWRALPRREQKRLLEHMRVATSAAFRLSYDEIERMLNGLFSAQKCRKGKRCAACRFGWVKP